MSEAPVIFTVPGEPKGKARARHRQATTKAGAAFISTYTPAGQRNYEAVVKMAAKEALKGRPPLACAVRMTVTVRLLPPASTSNRKRDRMLAGEILPAKKPDLDNVVKSILDACNKVVFVDDALVCRIMASKCYHPTTGVDVYVAPIEAAIG